MAIIYRPKPRPATLEGPIDWRKLHSCPIVGYVLDERGLVDTHQVPPHALSFNDLKNLINDVAGIEAKAMYHADNRLGGTYNQRTAEFCEWIAPSICLGLAFYFGTVKAPRAFSTALPANSVLIRRFYGTRMNAQRLERMCQKRRVLFSATNSRFMLFTSFAFVMAAVGIIVIGKRIPWHSIYNNTTKDHVLTYNQTEAALKYLYAVYFHHPVYKEELSTTGRHQLVLPLKGHNAPL